MDERGIGVRKTVPIDVQPLPTRWREPVAGFLNRFDALYGLDCAILYGSMATGRYREGSDIDLILISEGVPSDFWQRLKSVSLLYEPRVPLEALAYTPEEFHQMIEDMHVTALDATAQGIPLAGKGMFDSLCAHTEALKSQGLRRAAHAWVIDAPRSPR